MQNKMEGSNQPVSNSQVLPEEILAEKKVKIRIENLFLSFGGVKALVDVNIDIKEGEILAIIGPNGAGKTCVLNCINGFYKPQKGEIYFAERRITRIRPDRAAKMGLART